MRRKVLFAFALFAQCLFVLPSFSQTLPVKTHNFEIGLETYYMKYKEPHIMENTGWMYGALGSYTYHNRIMARVEARVATGEVDYSSNNTGSDSGTRDTAVEARGLLGYDFSVGQWLLTPYLGFGYRYLNDDSKGSVTTTGHLGYERESNYYYSPVGLEAMVPLADRWSLTLNGEADIFWSGTQKDRLSGAVAGLSDVEYDQREGVGARGSIRFLKRFETLTMSFGGFIRYWWINDSGVSPTTFRGVQSGYSVEPENHTYEVGAMFSILF
jgi:hypothetical protein